MVDFPPTHDLPVGEFMGADVPAMNWWIELDTDKTRRMSLITANRTSRRAVAFLVILLSGMVMLQGGAQGSAKKNAKAKVATPKRGKRGKALPPTSAAPTTTVAAATTTISATTTTAAPVATPTVPPTTVFPTRPSFFEGTGGLTATIIENPFKCTGPGTRPYVRYGGLVPGEALNWVWGLAGQPPTEKGASSAGGTTGQSPWQCNPAQAGQVITFVLTGSSGHSVAYDLVMTA